MSRIKKIIAFGIFIVFVVLPLFAANTLTSLQTDTFTRADATTLGSNWGAVNDTANCRISGNQAKDTITAAVGGCLYSAIDWPNDQAAQVTLATVTAVGTDLVGAIVRGVFAHNGNSGYYAGSYNTNSNVHLVRANGSCCTDLASAGTVAQGDVIQVLAVGCNPVNITVFQNGSQRITFTDSSVSQICSGSPGIYVFSPNNIANAGVTNWTGYAISNPATVVNNFPFQQLSVGALINLGNLTAASQAVEFYIPIKTSVFSGRLQLVVGSTSGVVISPAWNMECSQDQGTTWFQLPASTVMTYAPQLGDIFPTYGSFYDVTGLGGAACKFGLGATTGAVTGTLPVWVMAG